MAEIRGIFPKLPPVIRSTSAVIFYSKSEGFDNYPAGDISFPYIEQIKGLINNSERTTAISQPTNWGGVWRYSMSGEPIAPPASKVITGRVVKNNNCPYETRSKRGEMVVSDYRRFAVSLDFTNGGPKKVIAKHEGHLTTNYVKAPFSRPVYMDGFSSKSWSLAPEREYLYAPVGLRFEAEEIITDDTISAYAVGFKDHLLMDFLNSIRYPDEIHQLVTENTSDANSGTVDILTTLAELPETAAMCLQGLMSLKRLFVDAKQKKFRLYNKAKRVEQELLDKIKRNDFNSRAAWLAARNDRTRKRIELERIRNNKQFRANLRKNAEELATAIASVELTVRYGILPVKYTIDGFIESFEKLDMVFKRWTSRSTLEMDPPEIPGFTSSGKIHVSLRAFIKRKFEQLKGNFQLLKHLSGSLIVTAWELVPLSFVVDWLLNIGDVLKSLFGSSLADFEQAATISLKIESGFVTYSHPSGATVTAEFKGYMRNVINPSDYCRFYWAPDVSGYRKYDALALSWMAFKNSFLSEKHKYV